MPVERNAFGSRRGGGHLAARGKAHYGEEEYGSRDEFRPRRKKARKNRSDEDRDIRARLDKPGPAEHLILLQMLRKDRIFDRPKERRMDAHKGNGDKHQWNVVEHQAGAADDHDPDLSELDDADQPRLVMAI